MRNRVGTLTRPDNTEEVTSVLRFEPDISLLSTSIGSVVGVWQISNGGICHEDYGQDVLEILSRGQSEDAYCIAACYHGGDR